MKKHLYLCTAAAVLLTGCAKDNSQDENADTSAVTTTQAVITTDEETTSVTTAPPAVTTSEETTTTASKPDPKPEEVVLKGTKQLEIYSKVTVKDFVSETNGELVSPDDIVDTSKMGSHEIKVRVKYEGYTYEKALKYTVSDTTAPVVLNAGTNTVVPVGAAFDLRQYVGYGDNYDREPVLTYDGEVNTDEEGTYPITAHVTDSSGNTESWNINVTVGDNVPADVEMTPTIYFEDFISDYAGENRRFGIDVSHWQGDIDFEAVKEAGCEFVIIRLGYYSDDLLGVDEQYFNNIQNAKDAGLEVGVYYYSTDYDEQSIKEHAKWIADMIDGTELDLPVVFDWENFTNFQDYSMSIHDLNELYDVFSAELKKSGYDTMLYSSKIFLENFWEDPDSKKVWLAHYDTETDYSGKYMIWQRCGYGRIDGIDADVDLDIYYTK